MPRIGDEWWTTPLRPEGAGSVDDQVAAEARRHERARFPKTPRHHRAAAKAVAAELVAKLASWACDWRVTTSRPNPRNGWKRHHAMLCARSRGGFEEVIAEAEGETEAAALDELTAKLRATLARGVPIEDRYAAAAAAVGSFTSEEFEELLRRLTGIRVSPVAAADLRALGLSTMPDADGLRRAWRAAAVRLHPDAGGDAAKFIEARAAYERLSRTVAA